jgi:hypothetical protein
MTRAHVLLGGLLLALLVAAPASGQEADQEKAVDVSGVWELTSETPRGTMVRKLTFEQDGTSLTGNMETQQGSMAIEDGSVQGNKISFGVTFSRGGRSMQLVYKGTVDGDTAKGTMETPRGSVEWTAKRVST